MFQTERRRSRNKKNLKSDLTTIYEFSPPLMSFCPHKKVEISQLRLMKAQYKGELHCVPEQIILQINSKCPENPSKVTWEIGNFFFDENANLKAQRIKKLDSQKDFHLESSIVWHKDFIALLAGSGRKSSEIQFEISPFCIKGTVPVTKGNGSVELFIVVQ